MKDKKLIIFDIDRTIYDGSIGEDFIIQLVNEGIISPKILAELAFDLLEYELEINKYTETVEKALNYLAAELKNKDQKIISEIAKNVIMYNHYKFYDYVFELPKVFKEFDFAILSLEPQILVTEISKYLDIPNIICNNFPVMNNKMGIPEKIITNKLELLNNSKFAEREIVAVFGDSENDYQILKKAPLKFVINPTPNLLNKISGDSSFKISNPKIVYDDFKKYIINFA